MESLSLDPPARWSGSPEQQLGQCYSYLFRMREQLMMALQALDSAGAPDGDQRVSDAVSGEIAQKTDEAANALRALILKNADIVQRDMQTMKTELSGSFVAQSEFGSYLEQISHRIEADPAAITQYYKFASDLQANLEQVNASFARYKTETEAYIRTGIVYYENGTPVYGVAVGEGLTTDTVDGQTVVNSAQFRSVFTAEKLAFYQGDVEVAYLRNDRLYVENIAALGALDLCENWRISCNNGFAIRWIGG